MMNIYFYIGLFICHLPSCHHSTDKETLLQFIAKLLLFSTVKFTENNLPLLRKIQINKNFTKFAKSLLVSGL